VGRGARPLLALYHGQLSEARKRLGEARHLHETAGTLNSAPRDQLYLAEASLLLGLADDGVRELDCGAALVKQMNPPEAWFTLQYAVPYARRGRISQSSSLLEALRRADASTPSTDQPRLSLAHALLAVGRRDEATRAYESIVAGFPQAWEGPVSWAVAHLALGQIYEDAGEIDRARTTYAKLAQVWQQADQDLPAVMKLREARKRVGS
jgi:tetratricopeptide (TPR) repeat protein